jgi:predicted Fe-Mo cluster-binding NifX family protein
MKLCVPIMDNLGLDSPVSAHFGSAPGFAIADTENGDVLVIANQNQHHAHGMCQPLAALAGHQIDALLVGGIGQGALAKLNAGGIRVYLAGVATIREAVEAYKAGTLQPVIPGTACAHHGPHGHGHGHGAQH